MTIWIRRILMAGMTILLLGCSLGGAKTGPLVRQYALEYPPPVVRTLPPLDEVIRVERFSVAHVFRSNRIVYREKSGHYDDYAYHRWRAGAGDMVGDCLTRDLRQSGLFKAVFTYRDSEDVSVVLKGGVGEFFEADGKDGRRAVLSASVTLMDLSRKAMPDRILFQKDYRLEEPLLGQTVQGFVQAMSRATEKFSRQAVGDIYGALSGRRR